MQNQSKYNINYMYNHLTHTLPIFINENSKYLILGSFPSVKSREYNFYYSHPRNRFFPTLYKIFNEEHSFDISNRKDFLIRHNIALYDVIEECDIEASYDSSIKNVKPIDLLGILKDFPKIKVIGVNGGTAEKLFKKHLLNLVDQTKIKVVFLPSTSPANAKMNDERIIEFYKVLFF